MLNEDERWREMWTESMVRVTQERAHQKWQDAGCPEGCDLKFWLEAEQLMVDECTDPMSL